MTTGVTSEGFIPKTFEDIRNENAALAKSEEYYGEEFPTSPDSVYGVLSSIIAAQLKDQWDLSANVADQQNRDTAEGKYLNDLAALVGLTRLLPDGSSGKLLFKGINSTIVPSSSPVKDNESKIVLTEEELLLNRVSCYSADVSVLEVVPNTNYTLNILSDSWVYNSGSDPTAETIIVGLINLVGTQDSYTITQNEDLTSLNVSYVSYNNSLSVSVGLNLLLGDVGALVEAKAVVEGEVNFYANTLTSAINNPVGITSVVNPEDFVSGREEETDLELRLRMSEREQSTGTATVPSIQAAISDITGVTSALIVENLTFDTDSDGRPPKSYELYVEGGLESDIAETIWNTKPAGMATTGDIVNVVLDSNGSQQTVYFSRFQQQYAWVRVTYEINDEESFPSNGEDLIKEAVVETGDAMYRGEDFVPNKFYGNIYANVQGIFAVGIEIAVTNNATDVPVYQDTKISIPSTVDLLFSTDRVTPTI